MKIIEVKKIFIIATTFLSLINYAVAKNRNQSAINFVHELPVESGLAESMPTRSVTRYTPAAPYDHVTFTITAPAKVCVGQTFIIDYAVQVSKFTHISFWSDLIPDDFQGMPVTILDVSRPTLGKVDANDSGLLRKGGKGVWSFPKGLPANTVHHLSIKARATAAGIIKFSTAIATNPLSPLESVETVVTCNAPVVAPITVVGSSGQDIEIAVLDYVIAGSELKLLSVSKPAHGKAYMNEDQTILYSPPYRGFHGRDSFSYEVIDEVGNVIKGVVALTIQPSLTPHSIQ